MSAFCIICYTLSLFINMKRPGEDPFVVVRNITVFYIKWTLYKTEYSDSIYEVKCISIKVMPLSQHVLSVTSLLHISI